MKCRINNDNKWKMISEKGKEYSNEARVVEQNFKKWLDFSLMGKNDFLRNCNSDKFSLSFLSDGSEVAIFLENEHIEFVKPLVWQKKNGIPLKEFKADAALLLMYVANRCSNEKSVEKIKLFIRTNLLT